MSDERVLVKVEHLKKYFDTPRGKLHAVDDVSFEIRKGTTLGVVGESGCGKSTLGRAVLGMNPATEGHVRYNGKDITHQSHREFKESRRQMQMIFQDPYSSIDPKKTVSEIIAEPLKIQKIYKSRKDLDARVIELMEMVGLDLIYMNTYPHELDGGRRQRIGIARALALKPEFIVCDEPVSALDVSIQAQILNMMMDFQDELHLTYMFITHDLSVVKHISDEIMVLYLGTVVERAPSDELFEHPTHPYTKALLDAIPVPELSYHGVEPQLLKGEVTSPINPPQGCRFAKRCPYVTKACTENMQELREISPNHFVACCQFGK
ncbi:MAG: ATP-binding cassette domain-containing protein [Parasporobacterium sp.]|nr:ATP-binding cassette domain-containing protein [Parasporobacterium sp.]